MTESPTPSLTLTYDLQSVAGWLRGQGLEKSAKVVAEAARLLSVQSEKPHISQGVLISHPLLEDLMSYFEQRMDADGVPSGGGYKPNEEMSLFTRLDEERKYAWR